MKEWSKEEDQDIVNRGLELLKKGIKANKKWKFNREELYER